MKDIYKKFIKYPHLLGHFLGLDKLGEIHSDWIKYAFLSSGDGALQAHRNSYKTTAVLILGTVWYLTFYNPNARICILRKDATAATDVVRAIRSVFDSPQMIFIYKDIYGQDPSTQEWSTSKITLSAKETITQQGSVEGLGITGGITGKHFDLILPDDFVTIKDRISRAERNATKEAIKELQNIPDLDFGRIFYTGTPWHIDDAWSILGIDPKKYPIGSIDIQGMTLSKIDLMRKMQGQSLFSANYELKHIADENRIFSDPKYAEWSNSNSIALIDPAYHGDNTTALTIGYKKDNDYFLVGFVWREHINKVYGKIIKKVIDYQAKKIYIEENGDKGYSRDDLKKLFPSVEGYSENANKHIKIISFLQGNWDNIYFAHSTQMEYIKQFTEYTEDAELDDAPDSASSLIRQLNGGQGSMQDKDFFWG